MVLFEGGRLKVVNVTLMLLLPCEISRSNHALTTSYLVHQQVSNPRHRIYQVDVSYILSSKPSYVVENPDSVSLTWEPVDTCKICVADCHKLFTGCLPKPSQLGNRVGVRHPNHLTSVSRGVRGYRLQNKVLAVTLPNPLPIFTVSASALLHVRTTCM